jgi:hypothetical protein
MVTYSLTTKNPNEFFYYQDYNDFIDVITDLATGHRHDGLDQTAGGTGRKVRASDLDSLAADVDLGDYQIRVKQVYLDVPTGTAPLVVDSTTKVSNLNVDKVDNLDLPNTIANVLTDHTKAVHDALGINADTIDNLHLPNTIANVLTDHNKAVHDALGINADTLDGYHRSVTAGYIADAYLNAYLISGFYISDYPTKCNWSQKNFLRCIDTAQYNFWRD